MGVAVYIFVQFHTFFFLLINHDFRDWNNWSRYLEKYNYCCIADTSVKLEKENHIVWILWSIIVQLYGTCRKKSSYQRLLR